MVFFYCIAFISEIPVEDGEAEEHGHRGDKGAGGEVPLKISILTFFLFLNFLLGEVPGVVRHPPAEQPLHVGELESAFPDEGHHVHQHREHHHDEVGASVAWPWFEGHLKIQIQNLKIQIQGSP